MENHSEEVEINLVELYYVLKKRIIIILLTAIVFGAGSGIYFKYFVTPLYNSTAKLYILTKSTSVTQLMDIQLGSVLTLDYMELIYSRPVIQQVIRNQKLDETYESLIPKISVVNPQDTRILNITVTYDEPNTAKAIVDELANVSRKRISSKMKTDKPQIVESGHVNKGKVSPRVKRNTMVAAVIGAFLAAGIIIVLHLLNDTIRSAEDIEKHLGINVLASIPAKRDESLKDRRKIRKKKRKGKSGSSPSNPVEPEKKKGVK